MYNPELARYMQPDPIGVNGGMNIYSYVENNPLNYNDPMGLELSSFVGSAEERLNLAGYQSPNLFFRGYHTYEVNTPICRIGTANCNEELIFELLRCNPAPQRFGSPDRIIGVVTGDESFALTVGRVTHWVGRRLIVNTTISYQHFLDPGVVMREVLTKDDVIYVRTSGYGSGFWPNINSGPMADLIWKNRTDSKILENLKKK